MALPSLARTTVEILHPVFVVERGHRAADWSQDPATVDEVRGCSWQPGVGPSDNQHRAAAAVTGTLFMPPAATIDHHDRVRIAGRVYTVNGEPEPFETGLGLDHVVVRLDRWEE
jgi:hypothetical protein